MHPNGILRSSLGAAALAVALALQPAPAPAADANASLQALARDVTFQWAKLHPLNATSVGIAGEDGQLDTPSEANEQRDLALIRSWEARLRAIDVSGAPL